jgi:hypothetical protein
MNGRHIAVPVNQNRRGKRLGGPIQIGRRVISHHDRIIDLHLFGERRDRFPSVIVERYADHYKSLIFILSLKIDEPRDFDLTGAAPSRPEINHHRLAFVVGKTDYLAAYILQFKVGSGFAVFSGLHGLRVCCAGGGAGQACHQPTQNHSSDVPG